MTDQTPRTEAGRPCRDWMLWWRFGWMPFLATLRLLRLSEWRQEAIGYRVDIAAMNLHRRLHR